MTKYNLPARPPARAVLHVLMVFCACTCLACAGTGAAASHAAAPAPSPQPGVAAPTASLPGIDSLRLASSVLPGWQAYGEDFLTAGAQRANALPDGSAELTPNWSFATSSGEFASAVYALNPRGESGDGAVHLEWEQVQQFDALYLALADFSAGRWEWFGGDNYAQLTLAPRHQLGDGTVYLAVVCLGTDPWRLGRVHLGVELPSPHDVITAGAAVMSGDYYPSRAARRKAYLEPVCWASAVATGGDKLGLQGTLPAPGLAGYYGAGRVSVWTGHGGFWNNGADGKGDNDLVRQQWLAWLLSGGTHLGFARTHGEGESEATFDGGILGSWLTGQGVTYDNIDATLTPEVLEGYDALFIGNSWQGMPADEREAVVDFARGGGGVIVLSLGWAYYQYNDDPEGDDVLVNQLGEVFGWWSMPGIISDPEAPNGKSSQPDYAIAPLSEYTPAEVVVLNASEVDVNTVHALEEAEPGNIYVIEGQYTGIQLPIGRWADLTDPAAALASMEDMFAQELELAGGALPYGAEPTWFTSKYDPDGAYWMHSGNPVVYKIEAADSVINSFNDNGYSGWGFPHENGHNMVINACGNLFVHSGTAEEWCNVFNVYAHYELGWPERSGSYDDGWAYHVQANPDFAELTGSSWILLGCLQLVWDKYGWDGLRAFFAQAGADHAAGMNAGDDAAKTAYFVEQLSHAYQLDFAPLLTHWGFPVSDDSRAITDVYPDADIPW